MSAAALLFSMWKAVGAGCACATLPGSIELLMLSAGACLPEPRRRARSRSWRVAAVVPAHNEAASITSCVHSLLSCDSNGMQVDVYVVADNCVDDTALVAAQAGAKVLVRSNAAQRGKGYALHFAFTHLEQLGYDCMLVIDADTVVANNFIAVAAGAMRDGADAVQVRYLVRNVSQGVRTRLMGLALRAFNVVRPLGRQRLNLSAGILGNGFGLSCETLKVVPYSATSVVEDLEYHLLLVEAGRRVQFANETTVFGEIPVEGEGVKTQRSRWEGGRIRMIFGRAPSLLKAVLSGRFILAEPLLELLLLPLAFHVSLLLVAVLTPLNVVRDVGLAGLYILGLHLVVAITVGGGNWDDFIAIASAPFYILWKLLMIPLLLRNARSGNAWVRTQRNAERETSDSSAVAGGS